MQSRYIALVLIVIVLFSGCVSYENAVVTEITDGDTFKIGDQKVRLIGINAPEKGEQYYEEARQVLTDLILYREVELESDRKDKDRYGRLLRYVYVGDIFVNKYMIEHGYCELYIVLPNDKYEEELSG